MAKTWRTTTNSIDALKNLLAFNSRDWGLVKADAWLYGIVFGWDDDDEPGQSAMAELAERHGWDEFDVENLRELHRHFQSLEQQNLTN